MSNLAKSILICADDVNLQYHAFFYAMQIISGEYPQMDWEVK